MRMLLLRVLLHCNLLHLDRFDDGRIQFEEQRANLLNLENLETEVDVRVLWILQAQKVRTVGMRPVRGVCGLEEITRMQRDAQRAVGERVTVQP